MKPIFQLIYLLLTMMYQVSLNANLSSDKTYLIFMKAIFKNKIYFTMTNC